MKKLILLLMAFGFVVQLNAQEYGFENVAGAMNKFGVKLGVNYSNFNSNPTDSKYTNATKIPYIGMFSKTNISKMFTLQTELGYNVLGSNYEFYSNASPVNISLGYITIAALMRTCFMGHHHGLNFNLGLQYGYLIYAHLDELDQLDSYKSSDFDFLAGVAYEFDFGLLLELRYLLGLTNISNVQDIQYSSSLKNRAIQLQFGWMF